MPRKSSKSTSRQRKSSSKSFFYILIVVLIAIGVYFYHTNPDFKAKCDTTYIKVMRTIDPNFKVPQGMVDPDNPEATTQTSANTTESTSASGSTETSESSDQSASTSASTTAASSTRKSANGLVSLPSGIEFPKCGAVNHAKDHERRDYKYYSICYRESYEQAEWSAYCLDDTELTKNAGRSDDFRADPEISTGSATPDDYKSSGYDRGHLSPAADFAFDSTAMSETFYMSNMSPQAGSFNRGIWKDLESSVRDWAKKFGRVYVISGPILDEPASDYATIGKNKVSVPKYYYKVLLAPLYKDDADKATKDDAAKITAIAFIFPNQKCTDSYFNYVCTIDEVEKRTGINFFESMDDEDENACESAYDVSLWK